jgi:hypothetical protein
MRKVCRGHLASGPLNGAGCRTKDRSTRILGDRVIRCVRSSAHARLLKPEAARRGAPFVWHQHLLPWAGRAMNVGDCRMFPTHQLADQIHRERLARAEQERPARRYLASARNPAALTQPTWPGVMPGQRGQLHPSRTATCNESVLAEDRRQSRHRRGGNTLRKEQIGDDVLQNDRRANAGYQRIGGLERRRAAAACLVLAPAGIQ